MDDSYRHRGSPPDVLCNRRVRQADLVDGVDAMVNCSDDKREIIAYER